MIRTGLLEDKKTVSYKLNQLVREYLNIIIDNMLVGNYGEFFDN